jgi:CRP-like cAMP-binding protein
MGAHLQASRGHVSPSRAVSSTAAQAPQSVETQGPLAIRVNSYEFEIYRFLLSTGEATVSKFRKAESIFSQGDPAEFVIYLHEGSAKMMVVSDHGKEATIGVIHAGDFCGEGCLIDEPVRLQTAMTMSASAVLRVSKKAFSRLLREYPDFSSTFTRFLLRRSLGIQQDLINQRFHSSEFRLAQLLIGLSGSSCPNQGRPVLTRISQETLASMVGTTRSRISFFLNKFKKAGLIEYEGGIRINPGLEAMYRSRGR